MTIALDATSLAASPGGVARYTLELSRSLAEHFPDDEFWLLSDQPVAVPECTLPNLQKGERPQTLATRRWWLWGLQHEMMRRGIDLFHGTDFAVPYFPSRPSVMTVHDLSPWLDRAWQPDAGRVRRRTGLLLRMGLATMIITPSEAIRKAAIQRFHLMPDRVAAVPLAASLQFRPITVAPAAMPYFLFVGTLEPRKNIACLLEAWREVRKTRNIEMVLAGRARADFRAPEPEPGLRVLGAVPEEDLPRLYSGALAVVYPSLYEGFGLPVLEAMQCGAVVITSRDPAITEVAGGAAVQVDGSDSRGLVAALGAVADAPSSFAQVRERALERAAQFSWRTTAERTREVYDEARRRFRK
ncbi:MAG: glycosyltransferase family 1 protein [Bryobacteraceae bacterium]